jgi:molybdenum ABC transporter molybdate-binding protein
MEAIRAAYEKEHGLRLSIQYAGSSTLLSSLQLGNHEADLFIPADESYMDPELVRQTFRVAQMRPIVAVKKGNPLQIHSLDDLLTKNVRISMADVGAAATGRLVYQTLQRIGKWDSFQKRVTVYKGTVSEVAADLQVGAADAGIIWDAMLKQLPDFEEAPLPDLSGLTAHVVAGVLLKSKHPQAARDLATFLAAPDKGQRYFIDAGFSPP